jgi:hypothetical protein
MVMHLNGWGTKAASVVAIAAMLTLFLNLADTRYAMAGDMKALQASFHAQEVRDIEDKVAIIEDNIYVIEREDILTNREIAQVSKLKNRKAKYLRRLNDINPR